MDHPTTSMLLTWMTFAPLAGGVLILLVVGLRSAGALGKTAADQASRVIALVASAAVLVMAAFLWKAFDPSRAGVQFVQHARWIPAYNIRYFVGVDGISITLVILTALISFIATIAYVDAAFDQKIVDGAVNLLADGFLHGGAKLRQLQTGRIQAYLFGALAGAIAFVIIQYVIR